MVGKKEGLREREREKIEWHSDMAYNQFINATRKIKNNDKFI